jgi:hypothetical protein
MAPTVKIFSSMNEAAAALASDRIACGFETLKLQFGG